MIHIKDFKKHKNLYTFLKKKPLKSSDLTFMFDYCSNCIWCINSKTVFNSFSEELKNRIKLWRDNLDDLYMNSCNLTEEELENYSKDKELKELNKEGFKIAKEIKKQYSGSVSYFNEITYQRIYIQ